MRKSILNIERSLQERDQCECNFWQLWTWLLWSFLERPPGGRRLTLRATLLKVGTIYRKSIFGENITDKLVVNLFKNLILVDSTSFIYNGMVHITNGDGQTNRHSRITEIVWKLSGKMTQLVAGWHAAGEKFFPFLRIFLAWKDINP